MKEEIEMQACEGCGQEFELSTMRMDPEEGWWTCQKCIEDFESENALKKQRRGHPRMPIKEPEDLLDIMTDIFNEFVESLIETEGMTVSLTKSEREEFEYEFWYTERATRLIDSYESKLCKLFEKKFPEDEFYISTHLIKY